MSELKACPRCGGLNGYYTKQHRTVTRLYYWNDEGHEDADDIRVLSESTPRCMDCEKPLKAAFTKFQEPT